MTDPDPIGADLRRARARRGLPADAACVVCGKRDHRVLQAHHVAGVANDPELVVVLCRNDHHLNTLGHLDLGVTLRQDPATPDAVLLIAVLRGLAAFFALLAEGLMAWADRQAAHVRSLDANCPAWRTTPNEK